MLRIGQKVRVKSWKKMERQYGLDEDGYIKTPSIFTELMSHFCGKIYEIREIDTSYFVTYKFVEEDVPSYYHWDEEMLEPLGGLRTLIERRKNGNV